MLKKITKINVDFVTNKPKLVLAVAGLITLIAALLATTLEMELNWVALAPKNDKAVEEYQEILENFPTLDNMIMIFESDDDRALEAVANEASEMLLENETYIKNVTVGVDRSFMLEYGFLYMEAEEIEMMAYMLMDANMDGFYQMLTMMVKELTAAYDNGSISKATFESQLVMMKNLPDLIEVTLHKGETTYTSEQIVEAIERFFAGNTMMTSADGKMAMISIMPSFDMMDIEKLEPGVAFVEEVVETLNKKYANVDVNVTGMHVVGRDETASITSDSQLTTILSFLLILIILYIAFRSFLAPVLAFVPLIFGIIWSMGLSALFIGRLNMMTAFSAAMLLGLGIDYSIHLYSSYTEKRSKGYTKKESLQEAIEVSGPGIVTGALTTAVAFFALNISKLAILSELGTVMGLGIVTTLLAVFWILPALIILKKEKEAKVAKIKGEFKWIGKVAYKVYKFKRVVLVLVLLLTIFMGYQASKITFDTNLMNLEPEGLKSIEIMDYLVEKYDMSSNSFNLQVDSLDKVYELQEKFSQVEGVYEVTSVATVLPKEDEQKERLDIITEMKKIVALGIEQHEVEKEKILASLNLLKEEINGIKSHNDLNKLSGISDLDLQAMINSIDTGIENLGEMSRGNLNQLNERFFDNYKALGETMLNVKEIHIEDLPKAFKDQFVSEDEKNFMITVIPDFDIWENLDTEKGINFFHDIRNIDESITGTPLFMKVLYDSVADELLLTGILLLIILLTILFIHFRNISFTLLALVPLLVTLIFMVGIMTLINLPFNMLNFLSILLVIGIGIDDGVHILHHYKQGERNIQSLFSSVGRAISLTTMTTVFSFGSLMFSSYRGIATLGKALAIGVSLAFVMTLLILPIFLKDKAREEIEL